MEQKGLVVGAELAPSVLAPSVEKVPPSVGWKQSNLGEVRANCCHQWLVGMNKWEEHAMDGPHLHHSPSGVMEHGEKRIRKGEDLQI